VAHVQTHLGPATWYVVDGDDLMAYQQAGAAAVEVVGPGVAEARNAALTDAFALGLPCVQVSDDYLSTRVLRLDGSVEGWPLGSGVRALLDALEAGEAHLAGVSPASNPRFARHGISRLTAVVGDLIAVAPTPLRFDTAFTRSEDYDYTLQHQQLYGGTARLDWLCVAFDHATNDGGCQLYRTTALDEAMWKLLDGKWPGRLAPPGPGWATRLRTVHRGQALTSVRA
jgi:hypothetical protein